MASDASASSFDQIGGLRGRTVIVTGGAGPLGSVLSRAFAACGSRVVIVDLPHAKPAAIAESINATYGTGARGVACDLGNEQSLRNAAASIVEQGPVHALVNNAAFTGTSAASGWAVPFEKQEASLWRLAIEINLTAPFLLTQALLPALRAAGSASVVNISSIYGLVGPDWSIYQDTSLGNPAAYAASKGGS